MKTFSLIITVILIFNAFLALSYLEENVFYTNSFNDSTTSKNLTFSGNENQTLYINLSKYINVTLFNFTLSGTITKINCYQESMQTANQNSNDGYCVLYYNGSYNYTSGAGGLPERVVDGDWNTAGGLTDRNYFFNYTKPVNSTSKSTWIFKFGLGGILEYSLPSNCWNYDNKTLILGYIVTASGQNASCYNGNWYPLVKIGSGFSNVYEEAMNWSMNDSQIYIDSGSLGNYDFNNTGNYTTTNSIYLNTTEINLWLSNSCYYNYCDFPILLHSDTAGTLQLTNINISATHYTANYSFHDSRSAASISPTCTLNDTSFNYTGYTTFAVRQFRNLTCLLSGYNPFQSLLYFNSSSQNETPALDPYYLNLTFKYEKNGSLASGPSITVEIISDNSSNNYTTTTGYANHFFSYVGDHTIRYTSSGYGTRYYYLEYPGTDNLNVTLYLVENSTTVTANVYDDINNPVEDAYIKVLRYDLATNSYIVREIAKTNFEGQTTLNLVLNDEFYKFIIEYPLGTAVKETSPTIIYSTTLNFQIQLTPEVGENFQKTSAMSYLLSFNNATNNFDWTYSGSSNVTQGCLRIYKIAASGETAYNSSCVSSSTASILLHIVNNSGDIFKAKGYVYYGSQEYYVAELIVSFEEDSDTGNLGVFLIALLTVACVFIFKWSRTLALIIAPLPLLAGSILNLVDLPISITLPIEIVCVVIAIWLSKR